MKSPITGNNLVQVGNYWYDENENMYYIPGNNDELFPAISEYDGSKLGLPNENGLWKSHYSNKYYEIFKDGKFILAKSIWDGGELEPLGNNIWYSKYSKDYHIYNNGEFIQVRDPVTHSFMGIQSTGDPNIFTIRDTGHKLMFNKETSSFVPDYLPDDSLNNEPAHIEGKYLVGNTSGTKVKIGDNGEILTPTYLKIKEEVDSYKSQNGVWKGHKFIINENDNSILIAVTNKDGTVEYKKGDLSQHADGLYFKIDNEAFSRIKADEYDIQLYKKANKILQDKNAQEALMSLKLQTDANVKSLQDKTEANVNSLQEDADREVKKTQDSIKKMEAELAAIKDKNKKQKEKADREIMEIKEATASLLKSTGISEKGRMKLSEYAGNTLFGLEGQAISDDKYIAMIKEKTSNMVGSESTILSVWRMDNEKHSSPLCQHELVEYGPNGAKPLGVHYFNADEKFIKTIFEPAIMEYAQGNNVLTSQVTENQHTDKQNNSSYLSMSENNILQIENITPEYANIVSDTVQQVSSMSQQQSNTNKQNMGMQRTLTNLVRGSRGYINILELLLLSGVMITISFIISRIIILNT